MSKPLFTYCKYVLAIISIAFVVLMFCAVLVGCASGVEYREKLIVKDSIIRVASPVIHDTLQAQINSDSIISAIRLRGRDTIVDVRYFPTTRTFTIKAKPDTVQIVYRDTTHQTTVIEKTVAEEKSFIQKLSDAMLNVVYVSLLAVVAVIAYGVYRKYRNVHNDSTT